ncbi:MAG: iron-sulfur cluster assembly scaffold protein [Sulfuritalea sp.]|nr:iron-sulfur cluster assembly scaffold protein [Sulfuritalea sp.]
MNDSKALYQDAIKQFARAAHGHGQLAAASGEARLDNPLCGDRVRMQVAMASGQIAALAHETRGCLLCRAAASVVGSRAAGHDAAGITATVAALESLLQQGTPPPADWPELAMFEPARAYASRHRCVLLPFRALLAAMTESEIKHVER